MTERLRELGANVGVRVGVGVGVGVGGVIVIRTNLFDESGEFLSAVAGGGPDSHRRRTRKEKRTMSTRL